MEHILIIDDEPAIRSALRLALKNEYHVHVTEQTEEAYRLLTEYPIRITLLDWRLKEIDGLEVLTRLKEIKNELIVIMMTAYGTIPSTVEAMKRGAYHYLTKPIELETLKNLISTSLAIYNLKESDMNKSDLNNKFKNEIGLIGTSKIIQQIIKLINKIKDTDLTVLIQGESGTGKELIAKGLHFLSKRKNMPFSVVNCAAIPDSLFESEFFGYVKGAFTGANTTKSGKFLVANNGTIFLDEIGELSLNAQSKLLRVIQDKEVTPLGTNNSFKFEARIITATNRDLLELMNRGQFREDLYYRLNIVPIYLPPLRERPEDIPILLDYYLQQTTNKLNKKVKIHEDVYKILVNYRYPGNIRELKNLIEYLVAINEDGNIKIEDLPNNLLYSAISKNDITSQSQNNLTNNYLKIKIGSSLKEIEKEVIKATLLKENKNRRKTAEILKISERGLREKINKYEINKEL